MEKIGRRKQDWIVRVEVTIEREALSSYYTIAIERTKRRAMTHARQVVEALLDKIAAEPANAGRNLWYRYEAHRYIQYLRAGVPLSALTPTR